MWELSLREILKNKIMEDSFLLNPERHSYLQIRTSVWIAVFLAPRINMVFEMEFITDHIHL